MPATVPGLTQTTRNLALPSPSWILIKSPDRSVCWSPTSNAPRRLMLFATAACSKRFPSVPMPQTWTATSTGTRRSHRRSGAAIMYPSGTAVVTSFSSRHLGKCCDHRTKRTSKVTKSNLPAPSQKCGLFVPIPELISAGLGACSGLQPEAPRNVASTFVTQTQLLAGTLPDYNRVNFPKGLESALGITSWSCATRDRDLAPGA